MSLFPKFKYMQEILPVVSKAVYVHVPIEKKYFQRCMWNITVNNAPMSVPIEKNQLTYHVNLQYRNKMNKQRRLIK